MTDEQATLGEFATTDSDESATTSESTDDLRAKIEKNADDIDTMVDVVEQVAEQVGDILDKVDDAPATDTDPCDDERMFR